MLQQLLNIILSLFSSKTIEQDSIKEAKVEINWSNPTDKVSKYFTVSETCRLPSWAALHNPSEEEKANIVKMAAIMDQVRELLGKPINIHCWIRPILNCSASGHNGEDYNAFVKGATHSAHKIGLAVDWDNGDDCDDVRSQLEPHLESLGLRMEKMPGGNWVHLDCAPVAPGGNRYFIP